VGGEFSLNGVGYLKTPIKECYLSHEEIDRLLETCQGDLRAMLILALGTGMRASEVLGLDREQIDVKNTVIKLKDSKKSERRILPLPVQDVPRQVSHQTKQTGEVTIFLRKGEIGNEIWFHGRFSEPAALATTVPGTVPCPA
jgi:integrase